MAGGFSCGAAPVYSAGAGTGLKSAADVDTGTPGTGPAGACSPAIFHQEACFSAVISGFAAGVGAATAALVVSEPAGIAAKTTLKAVKLTIAGAPLIKFGFTVTPLH